jgi:hypothetical protein
LDRYQPAALVFDWKDPTSGPTGAFVSAGHDRDIPSISLPHGVYIWTNDLVNKVEQVNGRVTREYQNLYDRAVYPNRLHGDRAFEEGVRAEKIAVLGSARYCREWQQRNLEIQPKRFTPQNSQGSTLQVVFMLPHWSYNVKSDPTLRTVHRLATEPWLHLVLKPHTQDATNRPSFLKDLKELAMLPNVELAGHYGSVALIQGTDATISVQSDIAIEALLQGKHLLDPAYLYENTTLLQELRAGWKVDSDDELVDALRRLSRGEPPPYGEEEVSKAIEHLVMESASTTGVLERHTDMILGGWRDYPPYRPSAGTFIHTQGD